MSRKDLVFKRIYCDPPLFLRNLLSAMFTTCIYYFSIQLQEKFDRKIAIKVKQGHLFEDGVDAMATDEGGEGHEKKNFPCEASSTKGSR